MLASPVNLLLLFFCSQLLIYFDRGLISAVLPALSRSFLLSDSEMGLIGSCFIFGYMLACPLFAFFSRSYSVYKLMAIGLFLWSVAVLLCGLTNNFIVLLGARILTGVGEASFAGLAPACIDDVSPKRWRTLWLSFFYAGLPIGGAIGYIVGGELVHGGVVFPGVPVDWHTGFLLETAAMVPVIVTVFLWPDAPIAGDSPASPLSPPSPALLRRASTQLARYGSLNNSYSYTSRSQARPVPFNRRVSAPPYGYPTSRAGGEFHRARFASTLPPRTTTAPAPHAAAFSSSSPSLANDRMALPSVDGRYERRDTGRSASALSPSPPPLASTSAPSATVLLSTPRGGQQETASAISSSPNARSSLTAISPHSSARVVYIPSTPPHRASPFSSRRSPSRPTQLTVSTSLRSMQTAPSQPSNPMLQSRSASNLHSTTFASRPLHRLSPSPPPLLPTFSQQELVSPSLVPLPSSSSDSERLWYDIAWNSEQVQFGTDVTALFADNIYLCVVLGYSALAFVIGALSFWAPVDFSLMLHLSIEQSTKAIGVITFFCGILGTGFGGLSLDWWQAGRSKRAQAVLASLELCVLFTTVSIGFGLLSIVMTRLPALSLALLAVSNFFLFSTSAPINACLLSCSPPDLRSLAMAMSILIMHLLGDLPSPLLMGWITDLCRDVRLSLLLLLSWLGWTVLFWSCGAVLARRQVNELKLQAITEGRLAGEETAGAAAEAGGETETAAAAAGVSKELPADEAERKDRRDAEPKEVNGSGSEKEYGSWDKRSAGHDDERQPLMLH